MRLAQAPALLFAVLNAVSPFSSQAVAQINVDPRDYEVVGLAAGSGFIVSLKARNSYCCSVFPTQPNTTAGLSSAVQRESNPSSTISGAARGGMEPAVVIAASFSDTNANDNRVCVAPTVSANYKFPIASATSGETVKVGCENTTLHGGFNTNGTPINFLECTNVSDSTISGKVFAVGFAGQTLINGLSIAIQPGLRTDFDVHSTVGANQFGPLFVTHDGTKQALRCVLSRYSADLTLRSSLPFE